MYVCVYLIYIVYWYMYFDFVYFLFLGRNYLKGLVGLFLLFEGSGNILIFILLLKLILELRLLELEEIWLLFDIFELDFGIGWFILGLWFCIGCLSFSCKEIKLLIKKVCIVNEIVNLCNEKKIVDREF